MAEVRTIPTTTTVQVIDDEVFIRNVYDPDQDLFPDIINCEISETASNFPLFKREGDLIVQIKNYPIRTNVFLNSNGLMFINSPDSSNYFVDQNTGELKYNL